MANWGGLPSVVSALPADLRNFLQRVRETLDQAMSGSTRFVTINDLVTGNIAGTDNRGNVIALDSALYDLTPPPAPTGLVAAGALTTIMLQWDTPGYTNHAHAEIWRAATDNLGVAALIGTASGVLYADSVDAGSSYFYWVRFISKASNPGAYNATAGVNGTTSQDPTELLSILTDQITASQLHSTLGSRINLIDAMNTGLVTQVGTANQSIDDMAAALIQSTLDKADLLDRLARERAISDATVTVDPLTGTVTLLAEAAITTDVEARITTVETSVNAAAGTANTAIARLDVIGTVDGAGVPLTGTLHAMNTAIEANTDGIALKADSTFVESALADVNAYIASEADLPLAIMRLFLAGGNAIPIMQAAHIRVAHAEQTLTTHTDQLTAEAQARLTLAALVDQNIAAILSEQTARADADTAISADLNVLSAQVNNATTGLPAAHSAIVAEQEARATADSAAASSIVTLQSSVASAQSTANTAVSNAAAAQSTADTALGNAATANAALSNIASDSILSPSEKPSVVQDYSVITSEQAGIDAQATAYAITTEKTTYDNAVTALTNYLGTLAGWNTVPGSDVAIVGATFRSKFADVFVARQALLNAIASKAKVLADAAQAQANTATSNAATAQTTANTAVSAAAAAASTAETVQARLNTGDYAAVKAESSASAGAITGLSAEYSLKLDVNGFVSGYGTVNDGTSSEFLIATNQFGIVSPTLNSDTEPATQYHGLIWKNTSAGTVAGVPAGETRRWVVVGGTGAWQLVGFGALPFAVLTTTTTINGTVFQPGVYIDGASIVEASIGTAQIGTAAVDSANIADGAIHNIHVTDLAASKITTGTLQADQYISVGDSVVIDGAGHIRTFGTGNVGARDYSSLESGNLYLYRYIVATGQTVQYNYLSRMESGIANSGDTVSIPGYFRNQPKIMVSPAGIGLYKQAYANQDQSLTCAASNITETSAGSAQWTFDATATLNLAANTGVSVVNSSSGVISANTYDSAHQTTPANCASTTVSISSLSVRGNGISQYLYRQVSWRVGYRVSGSGSAYSFTTARVKAIGGITSGSVQDSVLVTFPSAAAWEFYVEYTASDVNTSTFGAISYTYSEETLVGAVPTTGVLGRIALVQDSSGVWTAGSGSGGWLPASTVNTSWEIYRIDYALQYDIQFFSTAGSGTYDYGIGDAAISCRGTQVAFEAKESFTYAYNESRLNVSTTHSYTGSSLTRNTNPISATVHAQGGTAGGYPFTFSSAVVVDTLTEKIYRRNPIANSTTPANTFILDSHSYSLSSAQVLASGSLNWLAVGM